MGLLDGIEKLITEHGSKKIDLSPFGRLRSVCLWEPPGADPHAGWCGGRGRKTPGYPIGIIVTDIAFLQLFLNLQFRNSNITNFSSA